MDLSIICRSTVSRKPLDEQREAVPADEDPVSHRHPDPGGVGLHHVLALRQRQKQDRD